MSGGLKYDPYGAELTVTSHDRDKFGTYYRDSNTGFNYADQRYYGSSGGRFLTPDPYLRSARAADPQTWNRYSYVAGDPVNRNDPSGLIPEVPGLLAPPNLSVGIGSAIDAWGLPWWMPFLSLGLQPTVAPMATFLPGFSSAAFIIGANGSVDLRSVNWDVVFGYMAAGSATWPDVWPYPQIPGWSITVEELLRWLRRFPSLAILAASVGTIGDSSTLPPDPSKCPDKEHFNDPTKPPHEGWTWRGPDAAGGPRGAWVSPSGSMSLHPDLNHPPGKPPHWDYRDPLGTFWECYEDGSIKKRENQ